MSTFPLALVHNPAWIETFDSGIDRAASLARSVPVELSKHTAKFKFYLLIRRINSGLEESLNDLDRVSNDTPHDEGAKVVEASDEISLKEMTESGLRSYRALEAIYTIGSHAGLRRKALTAGQMRHLHELLERMGDYVFWLQELADELHHQTAEKSFSSGLDEFARGETVAFL